MGPKSQLLLVFLATISTVLYIRSTSQSGFGPMGFVKNKLNGGQLNADDIEGNQQQNLLSQNNGTLNQRIRRRSLNSPIINDACDGNADELSRVKKDQKKAGLAELDEIRTNFRDSDMTEQLILKGKLSGEIDVNDPQVMEWIQSNIRIAAPWAIFFILLFLSYPCYLCYCCDCCPCCNFCRKEGYYQGMELRWPAALSLVCSLLLVAAGIYALTTTGDLEDGVHRFRCASVNTIQEFIIGDQTEDWVGLDGFQLRILDFQKQLDDFFKKIDQTFAQRPWITQQPQDFQEMTQTIGDTPVQYTQNPVDGTTIALKSNFIDKLFSGTDWKSDIKQYMGRIYSFLTPPLDAISNAILDVNQFGNNLKNDASSYVSQVEQGASQITDVIKDIRNVQDDMDQNLKQGDEAISENFTQSWADAFYAIIAYSVITSFILLLMIVKGSRSPRMWLHCAWLIMWLNGIIFLIIALVGAPISTVTMQVCGVMNKALNIDGYLQKIKDVEGSAIDPIKKCKLELNGDGDYLSTLDVINELNKIKDLSKKLEEAFAQMNEENANSSLNILDGEQKIFIPQAGDAVKNVITKGIDKGLKSENSQAENDQFQQAITNLNQLTQRAQRGGQNSCASAGGANDEWVEDTTTCTLTNNVKAKEVSNGGDSCIQAYVFGQDPVLIADRYPNLSNSFPSCTNTAAISQTYTDLFNALAERYNQFNDIHQKLIDDPNSVQNIMQSYLANVRQYNQDLNTFNTEASDVLKRFDQDNSDYIFNNFQCLFMGQNLDNMHHTICYLTVPAIYGITKLGIAIGLACFFGVFFTFLTAIRYYKNHELQEFNKLQGVDDRGRPIDKGQQYQIPYQTQTANN